MKSTFAEFAAIGIVLALIALTAFFLSSLFTGLTTAVFGGYHIVIDVFLFIFFVTLVSALTVRVILRLYPFDAEKYGFDSFPMLSRKAFVWKLVTSVTEMGGMFFIGLVPLFLRPVFFALFGAKIGKNVEIAGKLVELPLVKVGEYAFIGGNTFITAHAVVHDLIVLKPVTIGEKATIGVGSIIMPGVEIGSNSILGPGSVVPMDTIIPENEYWSGNPAVMQRKIKRPKT